MVRTRRLPEPKIFTLDVNDDFLVKYRRIMLQHPFERNDGLMRNVHLLQYDECSGDATYSITYRKQTPDEKRAVK